MKYAVISDVHANESALKHVLADAAANGAEQVVCLGDVVGYGPLPSETVALVRRAVVMTLCGNHDDAVSGRQGADGFIDLAGDAVKRHREALSADDLAWLKGLAYRRALEGALVAHGDFTDPPSFNYIDDEASAARNFSATDASLMFVGHTHVPCIFLTGHSGNVYRLEPQDFSLEEGKRYIVNPGSVGYPRENDGTCLSSYVLYDSSERTVAFRFIPFAVSSMMQRGVSPRRRLLPLAGGLVAFAAAAIGTAACFAFRGNGGEPVTVVREVPVAAPDLSFKYKSITLRRGSRYVRANLKLDKKGAPVELHVLFRSATGDSLGGLTETVKGSSSKRIKIPEGAITAHFTLSKQTAESRPIVRSFDPEDL